jgi:hypothetical protein
MVGVGRSKLAFHMYDMGYKNIICSDISDVLIKDLTAEQAELRPGLRFEVVDVTDMRSVASDSVDVVFDKCTSDTLQFRSRTKDAHVLLSRMFAETHRVLREGGLFMVITPRRTIKALHDHQGFLSQPRRSISRANDAPLVTPQAKAGKMVHGTRQRNNVFLHTSVKQRPLARVLTDADAAAAVAEAIPLATQAHAAAYHPNANIAKHQRCAERVLSWRTLCHAATHARGALGDDAGAEAWPPMSAEEETVKCTAGAVAPAPAAPRPAEGGAPKTFTRANPLFVLSPEERDARYSAALASAVSPAAMVARYAGTRVPRFDAATGAEAELVSVRGRVIIKSKLGRGLTFVVLEGRDGARIQLVMCMDQLDFSVFVRSHNALYDQGNVPCVPLTLHPDDYPALGVSTQDGQVVYRAGCDDEIWNTEQTCLREYNIMRSCVQIGDEIAVVGMPYHDRNDRLSVSVFNLFLVTLGTRVRTSQMKAQREAKQLKKKLHDEQCKSGLQAGSNKTSK